MITNYEKYLVLAGLQLGVPDQQHADWIADRMDKLFEKLSDYQKGCARAAGLYLNSVEEQLPPIAPEMENF